MASSQQAVFHVFPELPSELRLAIWRLCLPHRVSELDIPLADIVFNVGPGLPMPCELQHTTYLNGRPPILARVCRESRAVAMENGGGFRFYNPDLPMHARWNSSNSVTDAWLDPARDSVHLNWSGAYAADFGHTGSPMRGLAWDAAQLAPHGGGGRGGGGSGSFMLAVLLEALHRSSRAEEATVAALRELPRWTVVVHTAVVHMEPRAAAATGLFGLLGDARVRLVDLADTAGLDALFGLSGAGNAPAQPVDQSAGSTLVDLLSGPSYRGFYGPDREQAVTKVSLGWLGSVDAIECKVQQAVVKIFGSEEAAPEVRPAVMFRLCTTCNRAGETSGRGGNGATRGRGRRRGRGRGGM